MAFDGADSQEKAIKKETVNEDGNISSSDRLSKEVQETLEKSPCSASKVPANVLNPSPESNNKIEDQHVRRVFGAVTIDDGQIVIHNPKDSSDTTPKSEGAAAYGSSSTGDPAGEDSLMFSEWTDPRKSKADEQRFSETDIFLALYFEGQAGGKVVKFGGTDVPKSGGTDVPKSGGTDVPKSGGTDVPKSGGTDVPKSGGTDVPKSGGTGVPKSGGTGVPKSGGTDVPKSGGTVGDGSMKPSEDTARQKKAVAQP